MANMRTFKPSFAGGEVSPEMFGRIDDAKYASGAASIQNMITTALGPAEKRPGFEYVCQTKDNGAARLIPFTYSTTQTMVIEVGAGYFRFHTDGATLLYSPTGFIPWEAPSESIQLSYSTPTVVSWPAHGLTTGDPVRFYLFGAYGLSDLPAGLRVGYSYNVLVVDADHFNILDGTVAVALVDPLAIGPTTHYAGSGTATGTAAAPPRTNRTGISPVLSGLPSAVVSGGMATLNVSVDTTLGTGGEEEVQYQYSTGAGWNVFYNPSVSGTWTGSVTIPIANINQLQLRVWAFAIGDFDTSSYASGEITAWSMDIPTSGTPSSVTSVQAYRYHTAGDLVSYAGSNYLGVETDAGGMTTPGTDSTVWSLLSSSGIYEVPNSYTEGDLFDIHYVQSGDIVTLVHPGYPPSELRRLGPTQWTFTPIRFGPLLNPPQGVAILPSPGYMAKISSFSPTSPYMITTISSHTLSRGDGVYLKGLDAAHDGFYLVASVPADGTGALIPNQLTLMDYSGNLLGPIIAYSSGATVQFGAKIFDINNTYVVTALASDGVQESAVSAEVSVINNLDVTGSYNTIIWNAVTNAFRYCVYKKKNGLFGYIGETALELTFTDNNIACDMSITPPIYDDVFNSVGNYPGAVSYYQQRRSFAGTLNDKQKLWMSKSGTESDFSYSLPIKDSDRIAVGIPSRESSTIQHIIPLNQLVLLTSSAEICVSPQNSDVITPSTIGARPQSYIGASNVQPSIINNTMVYSANRGGHVREMGYQWQIGGYITGDVSLRAAHLFDNLTIVDQAFMKAPWQIVWFVSSSADLLGLTYIPEEQIGAWHHHVTKGRFLSIACVAEGAEDRLYAVIQRTVNGATVNNIERMRTRAFSSTADCFYVDSGATFDGSNLSPTTLQAVQNIALNGTYDFTASAAVFVYPAQTDVGSYIVASGSDGKQYRFKILSSASAVSANALPSAIIPAGVTFPVSATWAWARSVISGLTWLEGQTVSILADGCVQPQQVVTGGSVGLQHPSVVVTIGIPYTSSIHTLPLVLQIDAAGQGRTKNINKCWIRLYQSSAIFAGPSLDNLTQYKQRTDEPYGTPPDLVTDEIEITIPAEWQQSGQVYIQQTDPLPLTVVGLTLEAAIGG